MATQESCHERLRLDGGVKLQKRTSADDGMKRDAALGQQFAGTGGSRTGIQPVCQQWFALVPTCCGAPTLAVAGVVQ